MLTALERLKSDYRDRYLELMQQQVRDQQKWVREKDAEWEKKLAQQEERVKASWGREGRGLLKAGGSRVLSGGAMASRLQTEKGKKQRHRGLCVKDVLAWCLYTVPVR